MAEPLTEADYKIVLGSILLTQTSSALEKLHAIKQSLPEKTRQLLVGVHPGQDGEGFFDVMVHLDGPDIHVLNKAIAPYRSLFEIRCIDGRMQPDVPMFDPDEPEFSVNDAIVDTCMEWIEALWQQLEGVGLPAFVFGEEGYGTVERRTLRP